MPPKRPRPAPRANEPRTTDKRRDPRIVVAGDVTIDWLAETGVDWLRTSGDRAGSQPAAGVAGRRQNWQLHAGTRMEARGGGALLLAREIALATGREPERATVISYRVGDLRNIPPDRILHSVVEVAPFEERAGDRKGKRVFRVARFQGFSGASDKRPEPLLIQHDTADAEIVVLDDAGNGFRDQSDAWPLAIRTKGKTPLVVLKMSRPLSGGPLLERIRDAHSARLVLIINADDLRAEGVSIDRRLSWERTARAFLWQMRFNSDLQDLARLPNLVVRFGVEGAIHYSGKGDQPSARLFYDPSVAEDGFRDRCHGGMVGLTDAFTAALVARLAREGPAGITEGTRDGIRSARRFYRAGFGTDSRNIDFPGAEVFGAPGAGDDFIADTLVPLAATPESADPDFWCLLNELESGGLEPLAHQLLLEGERSSLRNVPIGEFGAFRTVDRAEIESFRSIQNLIQQYLERRDVKRPLCLAVFGPPGSGKSFGVEQVAKSVSGNAAATVEKLEFNLSQFETTRDLVVALHRVRDQVVKGGVPLVFFDEFDCHFGGPLGWLRYFLAPMQDGAFRDGDAVHPVGKAIFVFAGGLSRTFAHFSRERFDDAMSEAELPLERRRFREAKGPDFVSRLRGYVNVLGPNPDSAKSGDRLYLIRRAMITRSLLQRNWRQLLDAEHPGRLNISEAVVRALIGVPEYKHGVRSIEAVLEMSMLEGRNLFEPAALPPLEQLEQHVDAQAFARLVLQGVLFAASRDAIGEAIHEKYRSDHGATMDPASPILRPWSELDETYKRSNRGQATDFIRKLERVGCGYRPLKTGGATSFRFSKREVELLAELEHERWMAERSDAGYTFGSERDEERKTNPSMIPWSELSDEVRQYDRDTVTAIPEFMAQASFEVYRL